ncbi:MAG: AEC family transporter [Lactobacillus sp.]|uniref:AEC family transporter n=1 Tax=Lacticaseibacillus suilingensis TaxID=2799577 RepID=A0ABW4BCK5_9LACO|nr:AEC family transporter [Lacticaseibacillus suilingensis]MCI1893869.1 AEC family transporter [Lactobacillus sp.]MCI1918289.1 AEC family transporter [Lactobacillus sp.]MCI1941624.1 AEC family transporter [Lactobacillus sp.]MCI1972170.1 AEC family transporter [Lactobacillus sp.]MCI2017109.1 AEC family transporter [Lactobacillus sp.]
MTALYTSIESILTIVLMIALGYLLQHNGWFDDNFGGTISKLLMKVALPASIFISVLQRLTLKKLVSLSSGLVYGFGAVILGYLIAFLLVKLLKVKPGRRGTFINMFVNANTIFIGLPLNLALFGDQATPYFLMYYVVNTVSTWTLGAFLMSWDDPTKDGSTSSSFNWKKLLPAPLVGFLVALVFLLLNIPFVNVGWLGFAVNTLTYVGNLVTPLSLIYIGIILAKAGFSTIRFDRDSVVALLGRFVLAPALIFTLIMLGAHAGFGMPSLEAKTLIIQASAPGLAVLPILATEGHGDVEYATNVVTLSTVLFAVVVPIIMLLIQGI